MARGHFAAMVSVRDVVCLVVISLNGNAHGLGLDLPPARSLKSPPNPEVFRQPTHTAPYHLQGCGEARMQREGTGSPSSGGTCAPGIGRARLPSRWPPRRVQLPPVDTPVDLHHHAALPSPRTPAAQPRPGHLQGCGDDRARARLPAPARLPVLRDRARPLAFMLALASPNATHRGLLLPFFSRRYEEKKIRHIFLGEQNRQPDGLCYSLPLRGLTNQ